MYGISPDYLYHLTSDKLIPYYKPNGKKIYFLKEEIETWLLRNRQDTVDEMQQQVVVRDLKNNKR
ncbi:helix-turn-helix domain-containing protein [Alistipes sp. An54]|uniref:helix-turn-helix domain-containing protein n=3 Tax=Alistipes TaxID=239759 RepID=UPI001F151603|nr:helix-turn-helix domain-containing protein [Alistipes sp. An54]